MNEPDTPEPIGKYRLTPMPEEPPPKSLSVWQVLLYLFIGAAVVIAAVVGPAWLDAHL